MSLEIQDVAHAFGDRVALDGVSLDVAPGRLTGLLGPNGAGKTTLIRILLGVLTPDRGSVLERGRAVTADDRRSWGYMPQERGLYPGMRAGEQVVHFARLHGLDHVDATARARHLLDELGLGDRWSDNTDKLSGGMQQRLQLATALVHDPRTIVLDEPFSGLDPLAVAELSETLRRRSHEGRVVLFSSHQLDLVQDLCEDIVMIDRGRTVLEGRLSDLRSTSEQRRLRLSLDNADRGWLAAMPGVTLISDEADEVRLSLAPGADPLAVLDAARSAGGVSDFGLDLPTLSELFLTAAADNSTERPR